MEWRLFQYGNSRTSDFITDEATKYLRRMDENAIVSVIYAKKNGDYTDGIKIGVIEDERLPKVEDEDLDDAILIDVENAKGVITGTNERAVLIALYRFFRELGCIFVYPGPRGEIIPHKDSSRAKVFVLETPSYRHRGVCIEGANSYQNVNDIIDWLPKVGMNSYFTQFLSGYHFMRKWYTDEDRNFDEPVNDITWDDGLGMTERYETEVEKRSLIYHKVGHGWTCEPFGIQLYKWKNGDKLPDTEYKDLISVLRGERQMFSYTPGTGESPGNTNMCYSNPHVREVMTDAICDYCEKNKGVDYLHFWLADGMDNQCECDECKKKIPSDWYVIMLNLLEEKLSKRGIKTKIVFLAYVDLLWAPKTERIKVPERFTLMFAPITRYFSQSFCLPEGADPENYPIPEYRRNDNDDNWPLTVESNIAHLKSWSKIFDGDSFDYDYHAVGAQNSDPGQTEISRVMFEDMKGLSDIGLNGMMSCQCQRAFFPTSLLMEAMTVTLWNRDTTYDKIASNFFCSVYEKDGMYLFDYLLKISAAFDIGFIRGDKVDESAEKHLEMLSVIPSLIDSFSPVIQRNIAEKEAAGDKVRAHLWRIVYYHSVIVRYQYDMLSLNLKGKNDEAKKVMARARLYIESIEPETRDVLDEIRLKGSFNAFCRPMKTSKHEVGVAAV